MVGQHIGKYRVTEQIGRGGMGTVYRAVDETLHREVAIKVLNAELSDPTVAKRFRAEAVTVARLNHPGIATIYELVQHDGQWLMVMEFLRGETLEAVVARKGALPVEQAADLVMQTLSALAHAHGLGVVHRDLKPANLMLAGNLLKVMDFGIARVAGAEQLTSVGFMMGTPAYMAPEQVLGQEIDARTDLYATGLVFYYLTTGRLPFAGSSPLVMAQARVHDQPTPASSVRTDLPAWVGRVLDIALAREPEKRFQTALLFREALRRGLANLPIETPVPSVVPPELVATAAPSSLPIGEARPPVQVIKHTQPPAAEIPTVATAVPPPSATSPSGDKSSSRNMIVAAAVVVVLLGAGAMWFLRRPGPAVVEPPVSAPVAEASAPAAAPVTPAAPPPETSVPTPAPSVPTPPAAISPSGTTPPATPSVAGSTTSPVPVTGAASGRAGRGRAGGAPAETAASFSDVRAFVVTGRKVDERPATLQFAGGRVLVTDPTGKTQFGTLAYADITSAAHTRGKNPRWYPTLAGPPANVDMPGGLFRSDRHWLALQSRNGYVIVRLNDTDFQRVIDTANARLTVRVERLAPRQ